MNRNFIENFNEFKLMNIFSNLSQKNSIDALEEEERNYLIDSNERLLNYINRVQLKKDQINFNTIEPIEYINLISDYYKKSEEKDTDLFSFVKNTINNFKNNKIEKISNLLKFYEYQLNSSLSLWQ